jgi:hypothetical protein
MRRVVPDCPTYQRYAAGIAALSIEIDDTVLDAVGGRHVMNYLEGDLSAEITLPEWRRPRAAAKPRRRHPLRRRMTAGRHGRAGI